MMAKTEGETVLVVSGISVTIWSTHSTRPYFSADRVGT